MISIAVMGLAFLLSAGALTFLPPDREIVVEKAGAVVFAAIVERAETNIGSMTSLITRNQPGKIVNGVESVMIKIHSW